MSKRRRTWRPRPALAVRPTPLTLLPVPTGAGTDDHARTESDPTSSPGVDAQQVLMLIGLINTGGLDEYLSAIQAAIGERHQHRHRAQSNQAAARIEVGDRTVELSAREFALAEEFVRHRDQVLSREQLLSREHLLSRVWGYDFDPGSDFVDVYVRHLRNKLGAELIDIVRGAGYRLK